MSDQDKVIPKFTSFRAKAPPAIQQSSSTGRKRERSAEQHRSVKRHKTPDQEDDTPDPRRRDNVTSDRRRHRSRDRKHRQEHINPLYESDLFTVDRKGDVQNVTYQRLHKYSVPSYHRTGYGAVLGLGPRFRIDRDESTHDKIYMTEKTSGTHRPARLLLKKPKNALDSSVRPQRDNALDMAQDFVALSHETDEQRHSNSSGDELDTFRFLQSPERKHSRSLDSDEHDRPSADLDLQARQANAQLHRTTKTDPTNLQAWLDLVAHQQYLVRPGADAGALNNQERHVLADMRISIFEKALKHYPTDDAASRERLILGLLDEASLAWTSQKYMQKLQDILQQHPSSFAIWTKYLVAAQANPSGFRFDDVKSFFLRCFHDVQKDSSSKPRQETLLYLLLRYTVFLLDAGYTELSVAIWQALCEYHYFKPETLERADRELILNAFEQFWESETARIGESGAQGWNIYSMDNIVTPEAQAHKFLDELSNKLPFKSFALLERAASGSMIFPGRTLEEFDSDDPFHIIFFSDIKEIVEATAAGFRRHDFLDALLCYLGLPPTANTSNGQIPVRGHEWRSDIFLHQGLMQYGSISGLEDVKSQTYTEHYQMSTDTLFSRAFSGIAIENVSERSLSNKIPSFTKRILAGFVRSFSDDDTLAEYYLAYILAFFPNEASKTAKSIVKNRPSLRLYNACANIEARLGRLSKAEQIWSGTINMKNNFPAAVQQDLVLLWRDWIWAELKASNHQKAMSLLTAIGAEVDLRAEFPSDISPATLLRIRRALRDNFEHALSQSLPQVASLNVELMALATYFKETGSSALEATVSVFEEHCTLVETKAGLTQMQVLELMHQAKAGILAYHIEQKRSYKPSFVRSEMEASIALFPNNTLFLELYRDNEARFRIDDRVRSILKSQVLYNSQTPIVGWTFAIEQEMSRYTSQSSGSTAESVRSTYNRALSALGSPVRHSQTLWLSWFQFELDMAHKELSGPHLTRKRGTGTHEPFQRLNQVFLSGLHHLPWSKVWIVRGLEVFDREDHLGWDPRELRRLYSVLVERELRVRVEGLEGILDRGQII